ncbi:MAG: hypothetical protein J0H34_19500, partial [Rhizobiales bacterium]|nr:hypothetical protein [Hyphomicrobiales bacterium]
MAAAKSTRDDIEDLAGEARLEADIRQLREDVARLTEELRKVGRDGYGTARRAASEGVEQLRAKGKAA